VNLIADVVLMKPDTWEAVAGEMKGRGFTYDLDDDSHRMDIAQLVCEALFRIASRESWAGLDRD
jgi:hypothetical protein